MISALNSLATNQLKGSGYIALKYLQAKPQSFIENGRVHIT